MSTIIPDSIIDVIARLRAEGLITLHAARDLLGLKSTGTVRLYVMTGRAGVRLEAVKTPSAWMTSAAAVARFEAALTAAVLAEADGVEQHRREVIPTAREQADQARRAAEATARIKARPKAKRPSNRGGV